MRVPTVFPVTAWVVKPGAPRCLRVFGCGGAQSYGSIPRSTRDLGIGNTLGIAGYTSGEAYKIGFAYPYTRLQRALTRQTIDLGGTLQKVDAGINQFAGSQTADRLVLTVGKFSVADVFDNNKYAHDPRNDFLNWSVVDTGTFDYAAEPWGYTLGAAAEWYHGGWDIARRPIRSVDPPQQSRTRSRHSASSNGSAKSSAASTCGVILARSQLPDFSVAGAWAAIRTQSHWRRSPAARP